MNTILNQLKSSYFSYINFGSQLAIAFVCGALLLLVFPKLTSAQDIQVEVLGVDGELRQNVLATLKIYQQRKEADLSDFEMRWLLGEAPENIEAALAPFGYYSPKITQEVKETPDIVDITYEIDIGLPIMVRDIHLLIQGDASSLPAMQKVLRAFPLRKGNILNHPRYKLGKREILRKAFTLGFLDAAYVKSELRVHQQERWADIHLVLDGGARFIMGKTASTQDLIEPELLQRFLHYKEGDPYISRKLLELQRALYRTNFFGQVDVQGEKENTDGLKVPIKITLTEPPYYNRYSLGVGYSTDTGIQGRIEWENRLFNKKGHTVSGALKVSERENKVVGIYKVPVMDPWYDKLVYVGSWEEEQWSDTETRLISAGVSFEHRGGRFNYGGGLDFQSETYEVGGEPDDSIFFIPGVNFSYVTTENIVDTKNGLFVGVALKGSKDGVISDIDFLQGEVSGKGIITPLENWRLIGRFSLGTTLVDDIDSLPPTLRFYAGGDQSVRGYDYKELGPLDNEGNVIGGRYLIVFSGEIERLINKSWSIAAFLDTGNAMDDLDVELKQGVGGGVRYRLPFGQIRLDIASALADANNSFRIHLTVGGDL